MKKTYTGSYVRRNSIEDFIKYFSLKTWNAYVKENPEYKWQNKPDAFNVKKNIEKYYSDPSYKDYIDQKRKERRLKEKENADNARKHNDPVKRLESIRKAQKIGCRYSGPNKANGALAQIKSGQIKKFIEGGRKATAEYWDTITPEKKADHISKLWEGSRKKSKIKREKAKKEMYDSIKTNEFTLEEIYKASGFGKATVRAFLKDESLYLYVKKINGNTKVWIKNTKDSIKLYKKNNPPKASKLTKSEKFKIEKIQRLEKIAGLMEDNKRYSTKELLKMCSSITAAKHIIHSDEAALYLIKEQRVSNSPIYFTKK